MGTSYRVVHEWRYNGEEKVRKRCDGGGDYGAEEDIFSLASPRYPPFLWVVYPFWRADVDTSVGYNGITTTQSAMARHHRQHGKQ